MKNSTFEECFASWAEQIEEMIREYSLPSVYPKVMYDSMNYSLLNPGKRVRGVLLMKTAEYFAVPKSDYAPLCAAIEMIHAYSLIHDDLPCMDDDALRRGMPSNHIAFGYAQALLAGDGLLNMAYETMFGGYDNASCKNRYIKACGIIASAAGARGMVSGQCLDLSLEGQNISEEQIKMINSLKTGALISAAVMSAAAVGGADAEQTKTFLRFSELIGEMFQLTDDLLDVCGSEEEIGKPVGSDERKDKSTLVHLKGADYVKSYIDCEFSEISRLVKALDDKSGFFYGIADYIVHRSK